jgi:hypothetical protein
LKINIYIYTVNSNQRFGPNSNKYHTKCGPWI